ncbi:MAG TPA: winged helix DNA-binding domain-containing protein [Candidatus Angelobacter sp.]|nr:winged helix DNA-binding domain-containing protein [Candidatus Angelobacter sp.]
MTVPMLSVRALNRTLLARQELLERRLDDPVAVMESMGGIQMQYAPAGYIGLWSRVLRFERSTLTRLLEERRAIQGTLLRATIHTVSAADYWPTMAGIGRANREWYARVQAREIGSTHLPAVAAAVREELAAGPMRITELSTRIEARGFPARATAWASTWVPMVRVPPSGTWERRRADLYALADGWLPPERAITEDEGIAHLVRRYLGAFGPAPMRDIATWMGLSVGQVRHVAGAMELRPYRDESGRALVDLPELEVVSGDQPAPPRFLAVWDAALLVHARRTQILPEPHRPRVFNTRTPHSVNTFLVDGRVAGTWRYVDDDIALSPFGRLAPAERAGLEDEAHRLAAFHRD